MTKRYFVFRGHNYYPAGGWSDFASSFDTTEEAYKFLTTNKGDYDWCQIVDTETERTIFNAPE